MTFDEFHLLVSLAARAARQENQLSVKFAASWACVRMLWTDSGGNREEAQQVSHPPVDWLRGTNKSCLKCTRRVTSKKCVGSNNVACILNDICHVSVSARVRAFFAFIFSSGRSDMSVSPSHSVAAQENAAFTFDIMQIRVTPPGLRSNATQFETDQWPRVTFKASKEWFSEHRLRIERL